MVLSKAELIAAFQHEVHVLLHLAGKIDRAQVDYRPTPKQRSTFELIGIGISIGVGRVYRPIADRASTDERVAA